MSTPPPVQNPASPPAGKEKEKAAVTVEIDTKTAKDWSWYIFNTAWGLIPLGFALLFSGGAAYLSYQRNQSAALAILAFVFATLYYPYYALTSGGSPSAPVVSPTSSLMTAGRRLFKAMKKH
jgi:hypothetical protein